MKTIIVLLALVAVTFAARSYDLDLPAETLFEQWTQDFGVTFASIEQSTQRFDTFKRNIETIRKLNAENNGAEFNLNKFAIHSAEEFAQQFLSNKPPQNLPFGVAPLFSAEKLADTPSSLDWRKHDPPVVTPVKDQRSCGSCWAFSTTGNIEGVTAVAGHPLTSLSEQNLVDCDHVCNAEGVCDSGCDGGLMENAFTYVIETGGIDTEESYPYEGRDGKCRFSADNIGAKISNFTFIAHDPDQMATYLATNGPLSIAADATTWQFYTKGVLTQCGTSLNHGILIVGYDNGSSAEGDSKDVPYWIIKNSWGTTWGLDGYILVEKGNNVCGIEDYPISATL